MRKEWKRFALTFLILSLVAALVARFAHGLDFGIYYAAGNSLLAGRVDLYSADFAYSQILDYHYPPAFLLIFTPIAMLPREIAEFVWCFCLLASLYAAFRFSVRSIEVCAGSKSRYFLIPGIAALVSAKYILLSLIFQNVHIFVCVLVLIGFGLTVRKRIETGSLLYSLGIAIKFFPVVTLPYLVLKRQWPTLGLIGAFVLAFALLPAVYFGPAANLDLHRQWIDHTFIDNSIHERTGPLNHSIKGVAERYFSIVDHSGTGDAGYPNVNIAEVDKNIIASFANVASAIVILVTFGVIWHASRLRNSEGNHSEFSDYSAFDRLVFHEFGLLICMSLLIGPRTNIIYFVALFIPMLPFLYTLFKLRSIQLVAAFAIIVIVTVLLPLVPGSKMQRLFLALGTDFFATLTLWSAMVWIIISESSRARTFEHHRL